MKVGQNPTKSGLIAAPIVLATPVTPPAAARSRGSTSAMTYDCLVESGPALVSREIRQSCLLNRQEWTHFLAAWADHAGSGGNQQEPE